MSEIFYVIVGEKMKEKTSLYNDIKSVERWKPGHHEIQTHEDGIKTVYEGHSETNAIWRFSWSFVTHVIENWRNSLV